MHASSAFDDLGARRSHPPRRTAGRASVSPPPSGSGATVTPSSSPLRQGVARSGGSAPTRGSRCALQSTGPGRRGRGARGRVAEVWRELQSVALRVRAYAERRCGQGVFATVGLSVVAARFASWRGPASRRTGRWWLRLRRCCAAGAGPVAPGRVGPAGAVVRRAGPAEDAGRGGPGRGAGPGAVPRGRPGVGCGVAGGVGARVGTVLPRRWRGCAGEGGRGGRAAEERAAGRGGPGRAGAGA